MICCRTCLSVREPCIAFYSLKHFSRITTGAPYTTPLSHAFHDYMRSRLHAFHEPHMTTRVPRLHAFHAYTRLHAFHDPPSYMRSTTGMNQGGTYPRLPTTWTTSICLRKFRYSAGRKSRACFWSGDNELVKPAFS